MKILEEITSRSRGVNLREDNILFMISNKLKDIANDLGIFIFSSTQVNSTFKTDPIPDQNLLRGAKSLADLYQNFCKSTGRSRYGKKLS